MAGNNVRRNLAIVAFGAMAACSSHPQALNTLQGLGETPTFVGAASRAFARTVEPVISFDLNSAVLDKAGLAQAAAQAEWMLAHPETRFSVTGHTDSLGDADYNQQLGLERAQSVVTALIAAGVAEDRLLAKVSFGEDRPIVGLDGSRGENRRTVTEVLGAPRETGSVRPERSDDRDDRPPANPKIDGDPILVIVDPGPSEE